MILLFAALHLVAAIITTVVIFVGLIIVLLCVRSFYIIYRYVMVITRILINIRPYHHPGANYVDLLS